MVEYKIGDRVEVLSTGAVGHIASTANKYGEYEIAMSDHIIPLTLKHYEIKHYEDSRKNEDKFKLNDKVYITYGDFSGLTGVVEGFMPEAYKVYIEEVDHTDFFKEDRLELCEEESANPVKKEKDFVSIANEIGKFTQMKNEAYGSSVDATEKIMEVLMERYLNTDTNTYEFPRSLLKHILLQVRIMDKQNRLFSNPDGDKLNESIYKDLTGYGLIGIEMDERNS